MMWFHKKSFQLRQELLWLSWSITYNPVFSNFSDWPMRVKITYYYGILSQPMRKEITKFWLYSECTTEQELCLREARKLICVSFFLSFCATRDSKVKVKVKGPNMCYIFEKHGIQGYWIWHSCVSNAKYTNTRLHFFGNIFIA